MRLTAWLRSTISITGIWWDRSKENNSENTENKSSNNPDDKWIDKNNKNGDSDKNNSPDNTGSKGEKSRGSQGGMK